MRRERRNWRDSLRPTRTTQCQVPLRSNQIVESYEKKCPTITNFEVEDPAKMKFAASTGSQFSILFRRAMTNICRTQGTNIQRYCISIFLALLALVLYYDVLLSMKGVD